MLFMKWAKVNKLHIEIDACQQLSNLARCRYSGLQHAGSPGVHLALLKIQSPHHYQTVQSSFKALKFNYFRAHELESRSLNGLGFTQLFRLQHSATGKSCCESQSVRPRRPPRPQNVAKMKDKVKKAKRKKLN